MTRQTRTLSVQCTNPGCDGELQIQQNWDEGGVNDAGGMIIECRICAQPNDVYIGIDIYDSRLLSGGKILGAYDSEIDGDRARERENVGLPA